MIKITLVLSTLLIASFAMPSFLESNTCSKKGEKCGHELEGQNKCCDGLSCNFLGTALGAPGVCREVCAKVDETCGHELEGQNTCCSGLSCQVANPNMLGARGLCKPVAETTCAVEGQSCGHELEGRVSCCQGLTCFTQLGAPLGSKGVCTKEKNSGGLMQVENFVCSAEGKSCGDPIEGGFLCCPGTECFYPVNGLDGAKGVCRAKAQPTCAAEGQVCGHELEGDVKCCQGYSCARSGAFTGLGAKGVCVKDQATSLNVIKNYRCGAKGEKCGLAFEGGLICCHNHECVYPENSAPGSSGTCQPKPQPACSVQGQVCGHELEGQVKCCDGYTCLVRGGLGSKGFCSKNKSDLIPLIKKYRCGAKGEQCGVEFEGGLTCCPGNECVLPINSAPGAKGQCKPKATSVCAVEGQACGHEREGQKSCCGGLNCYFGVGSPLGATGVCLKNNLFDS
jgi:hypothetical protein